MISKQKIIIGAVSALAAIGLTTGIIVANVNGAKDPSQPSLSLDGTSQSAGSTTTTVGDEVTTGTTEGGSTEATVTPTQPPHEHSFPEEWTVAVEPDCENPGIQVRYCKCGEHETQIIPATGHSGGTVWVDNEDGTHTEKYSCCGLPVHDSEEHNYGQWTVHFAATCTEAGLQECFCEECNNRKTEVIDAFGHTPVTDSAVAATCKDTGLTEGSHCTVCDAVLTAQQEIPLLTTHDYDEETGLCACCSDCSVGLYYTLNDDETEYTVSGIGDCTDTALVIPGFFNGIPVTAIDSYALYVLYDLTSVTIPASVTSIGRCVTFCASRLEHIVVKDGNAFYSSNGDCLVETTTKTLIAGCENSVIPNDGSVTCIARYAFCGYDRGGLTSVTIPSSVTCIEDYAFSNCPDLKSVTFEENSELTSIGSFAFSHCTSLTSIVIPFGVTCIDYHMFYGCTGLTSVTFAENSQLTSIGDEAFSGCSGLTSITFKGTKEQWNEITKDSSWNRNSGEYTIHCTDGDISKDGTFTPKSDT